MYEYTVLKPFQGHAKGDKVMLNQRQALHLELADFIKPVKKAKAKTGGAS